MNLDADLFFGNYHINWGLELWQDETEMRIKFSGFFWSWARAESDDFEILYEFSFFCGIVII